MSERAEGGTSHEGGVPSARGRGAPGRSRAGGPRARRPGGGRKAVPAAARTPSRPGGRPRAGGRRPRSRLRRHRHQPALRPPDRFHDRPGDRQAHARRRVRRDLADVLVDHARRLGQVRRHRDARRQRGRGRGDGPDRPRAPPAGGGPQQRSRHRRARRPRRVPVLRGQPHHPRDLRAVRRRGPAGRRSAAGAPRPPDRLRDPRRAVRRAALRHGPRRGSVRTDHDRLVLRARPRRHRRHREASGGDPGALADLRRRVRGCARLHRVRRDRGRRPLHHRRRGAVRRHGAFRQAGDRAGLVPLRLPGAHPELPGPGGR